MRDPNNPRDVDVHQFDEIIRKRLTRGQIRKMKRAFRNNGCNNSEYIWIGSLMVPEWKCYYEEILFAIWEDDRTDETIIHEATLGLSTDSTSVISFNASVSIDNNSKDDIIRNLKISNRAFFYNNSIDQGCGCKYGEGDFSNTCWPIWDGGADVAYTLPHIYFYP